MITVDDFTDKRNTIHAYCVVIKLLHVAFLMIFNCRVCSFNSSRWKL